MVPTIATESMARRVFASGSSPRLASPSTPEMYRRPAASEPTPLKRLVRKIDIIDFHFIIGGMDPQDMWDTSPMRPPRFAADFLPSTR